MPRIQALVVGLGQFGLTLARSLAARNVEVVAIDRRADRVQLATLFAADALSFDATDETQLALLRPAERDLCIVAIGEEGRDASIVVTALLRQMGARKVLARAINELHERILMLVGAHEVVNPERIFGERLAFRLSQRGVVDVLPLGEDLAVTELNAPPTLVGRTLADLHLPRRFGLTVIAVRRVEEGTAHLVPPRADLRVHAGDVLVLVGEEGASQRLVEST